MSGFVWFGIILAALLALAFAFRFVGQTVTGNRPWFRDMPFGQAFGYVFGAALLAFIVWFYFQPPVFDDGRVRPSVVFFRWAVQGVIIAGIAGYIFKKFGEFVGTQGTRKLFRSMPITAAFGILTILTYTFVAIFAGQIQPLTLVIVAVLLAAVTFYVSRTARPLVTRRMMIGSVIALAVFVVMYFVGPLAPYEQAYVESDARLLVGADPNHVLGTDQRGGDLLTRLIFGAQNTVGLAFVTTCLAFAVGVSLGFLAAIWGGWPDQLLSRGVDVLMAIPSLIFSLLLLTTALVWTQIVPIPLTVFMVVIIALIDSTRVFRLARAVAVNITVMDYFEAAKLRGEKLSYLIFREIMPNATAPLLAEFGLRFCFVFLSIAALSFLGVGIQPPLADWGTMVNETRSLINWAVVDPYRALPPLLAAGAIALLTIAVNFVVDWMLHRSSGLKE